MSVSLGDLPILWSSLPSWRRLTAFGIADVQIGNIEVDRLLQAAKSHHHLNKLRYVICWALSPIPLAKACFPEQVLPIALKLYIILLTE